MLAAGAVPRETVNAIPRRSWLLRGLKRDVDEGEFGLARPGRALGVDAHWHPDLMDGIVPIPVVDPGDTAWWHPDVVHAVGKVHHGHEFANVICIGASPECARNEAFARRPADSFLAGRSALGVAAEDHAVDFRNRNASALHFATGKCSKAC